MKHLPLSFAETEIFRHFSALSGCEVTDVRLMRTPDGRSRQLAFIGYRSPAMAAQALRFFDRNFIRTSRIAVQFALEKGSAALARPWSKWSSQQSQQQQAAVEEQKQAGSGADSGQSAGRRGGLQSLLSSVLPASSAASLSSDSLFQEYLQVMGGKGQRKVWDNDEAAAAAAGGGQQAGQARLTEAEEKQEAEAERQRLLAALDDDADSEDDSSSAPQPVNPALSDADYLNSRQQTAAFEAEGEEEEEDDDRVEERKAAQSQFSAGQSGRRAVVAVPMSAASALPAVDERRLFIRNLPFSVREEDLRSVFSPFGAIDSLHIPVAADGSGKGFAFVSFASQSAASHALAATDGKIALGRILHVLPSQARPTAADTEAGAQLTYKKRQELQRKAQAGSADVANTLFLRPDTVMASMADRLSVSKAELLDVESGSSLAVRMALAETQLIAETKSWLAEQGVNVGALERRERVRAEAAAGGAGGGGDSGVQRSSTVILVKNIPYETELSELRAMFGEFGELLRVVLPPSRSLAIVAYSSAHEAKKGFTGLAYSKFHHVPLYLEWAPIDTMTEAAAEASAQQLKAASVSPAPPSSAAATASDEVEGVTIFVKNLSFSTTEASLLSLFAAQAAVRSVHIATKKNSAAAVAAGGPRTLSMGFGFVELRSASDVLPCIQRMQGAQLDGHSLQLSPSTRSSVASSRTAHGAAGPAASRRVIVKICRSRRRLLSCGRCCPPSAPCPASACRASSTAAIAASPSSTS